MKKQMLRRRMVVRWAEQDKRGRHIDGLRGGISRASVNCPRQQTLTQLFACAKVIFLERGSFGAPFDFDHQIFELLLVGLELAVFLHELVVVATATRLVLLQHGKARVLLPCPVEEG